MTRRAFTLIELVVALGAAAILMAAVGSVLTVARKSVPTPDDPATAMVSAWGAADRFAKDLTTAKTVTGSNPWTLTLPDRDGDTVDETIVWTWDTPSTTLTRQVNGDPAVTVLGDVKLVTVSETWIAGSVARITVAVFSNDPSNSSASVTTPVWNLDR